MRRIFVLFVFLLAVPLATSVVIAQESPPAATPNGVPVVPPAATATPLLEPTVPTSAPQQVTVEGVSTASPVADTAAATQPPAAQATTVPPAAADAAVTALPATPTIAPPPATDSISLESTNVDRVAQILLPVRNDIEILANNTLGAAIRPTGWNGAFDVNDPQMALKARLDLELLADELVGARPAGWFGVAATSAYATARDIRHDLELLADAVIAPSVRPPNWMGDNPIMRCSRSTQAMALLLESRGLYTPTASPGSPTYCADLDAEVSVFAEVNLLDGTIFAAPPRVSEEEAEQVENPNVPVSVITPGALAYYDRGASQLAGAMPQGILVTPVARSFAEFSRMTLVRGEGFEVFVDYRDTTLDQRTFEALGDINALDVSPSCAVEWCVPAG